MPILNWIGKEKIVNHDKEVPFRLLRKNKKYSLGKSENLIVEGDNLEALKALMPFYYGKIKCIYIDPPYNTGNEKWVYNDKVNAPKIKEWLGKVVGPEGEDLTRHDKWLCMMYPRLKLLRDLLDDDGVIFISIDDSEQCNLKIMMDEIFGPENFVANIIWQKKTGASDARNIAIITEYVLAYSKNSVSLEDIFSKNKNSFDINRYKYSDEYVKIRGRYYIDNLDRGGLQYSDSLNFPIKCPDGSLVYPNGRRKYKNDGWIWKWGKKKVEWAIKNKFIEFRKSNKKQSGWSVCYKNYLLVDNEGNEMERSAPIKNLITDILNADSAAGIKDVFGNNIFKYSKPVELIKKLISYVKIQDDEFVLDSFAGSGTTGQAVLDLNKEDGGNRKFILVEMEKNIAKNITAERVKRVARGYSYKTGKGKVMKVPGLGGGFEYVELGEPLFNKDGMISESVSFEDMAHYVYFTETRTNLEKKNIQKNYLGEFDDVHYFLLFDGIGKNILNRKFLKELKPHKGEKKIIYADKCLLDDEVLEKNQIIFKQIPYQIKVY